MNFKFNILVLFLSAFSFSAFAQEAWSLDECVSYAIEHNLSLNDFEYTELSDEETYKQSIRNLLPSVNGYTDYFQSFGRAADPNSNIFVNSDFFANNYSLTATIDLFQGFQKINTIRASKLIYGASLEDVEQQKFLLAFRVMKAYYDIKFFEGLLVISQEQLQISQNNFDLVKRQVELGLKAGADLYEAESLLLTDELALTQSQNNFQKAQLQLIQEMNFIGKSSILLEPFIRDKQLTERGVTIVQQDSIFNNAMSFIPIIKAQQLRAAAAKKQLSAARGLYYPRLSLAAGYGTGYFETFVNDAGIVIPYREQLKNNASKYIGFSLNIPILNGWSARSKVKQQKIELLRADNNLDLQEQQLYLTIQELIQDYNSLQVEIAQSAKKVQAQELAFTIAQKRYERGLVSVLDLTQAKNLFATAQNENLQVLLRFYLNKSTLDFYNGLPVFNINQNN
ncbi:TolC family protein [uncultured Eudoraea sp.]|uniref:TolC family protein n=1 Tax=uncultured Eudoraea sp. TaxID=1035614 RepID=UPI0026109909|nr:TolC family protein [uncultured Eudoraea sp.]